MVKRGQLSAELVERLLDADLDSAALVRARIERSESKYFGDTAATTAREGDPGVAPADVEEEPLPEVTRFELRELIGRGGFGEVWLGYDHLLRRRVAVKTLLREGQSELGERDRFLYEARATARLTHPGVIPIYDVGKLVDGRVFYAMQRVAGATLEEVIDALRRGDPAAEREWPLPRLLAVFAQVCQTVSYAHDHGFIHRDLKPANLMLGEYGEVFVADWGLARAHADASDSAQTHLPRADTTTPGATVGTLSYMPPEQVRGEHDRLRPSTDVYSLGAILYELLTWQVPYNARTPLALTLMIVRGGLKDPRELETARPVPDELAELCIDAMKVDAADRIQTASEFAGRVNAFLNGVEAANRRRVVASEAMVHARGLRDEYQREMSKLEEGRAANLRALEALPPGTPVEERMPLWESQQRLEEAALQIEEVFGRAVGSASLALDHLDLPEAHGLLADLYWQRHRQARAARDDAVALYFLEQVRRHDRGRYSSNLLPCGRLIVVGEADFTLERQMPLGSLLMPRAESSTERDQSLPAGGYVLVTSHPRQLPARIPVRVERGEQVGIEVTTPRAFPGHEEFVYVAGGSAPLGGDEGAVRRRPRLVAELQPFLIGRYPVTLAQYVDFLNAISRTHGIERARAHAVRSPSSSYVWLDMRDGVFSVPEVDRDGDPWDPQWPAHMLNWHDANAYCAWRTERDGATFRLPTEDEWELAARGMDERIYPWGNGFDATLCRMVDSVEGRPGPMPVGSYIWDRSPYGVCDMAGNVSEWTQTADPQQPEKYLLKGGNNRSAAVQCRAASRISLMPVRNGVLLGFRIVRDL